MKKGERLIYEGDQLWKKAWTEDSLDIGEGMYV